MRLARAVIWVFFLIPATGGTRQSPAQPVEGLVNIRFHVDVQVFAAMAAINIAGFDLDAEDLDPGSARAVVRDRLAEVDADLRERLRQFYGSHAVGQTGLQIQGKFVSYALFLNGPPSFSLAYKPAEIPTEVQPLIGFESLLQELWSSGQLDRLWEKVRPLYLQEIASYRPLIRDMILETLQFTRTTARVALDREMIFMPDLLNGYGIVNARNIGRNYIVLVGPSPSEDRPVRSIRHEYLHFLLDPLIVKYAAYLPDGEPFLEHVNQMPKALPKYRESFELMVTESLLQMLEQALEGIPEDRRLAGAIVAYQQGLVLAPYFAEELRKFESVTGSLPEHIQSIFEGISWDVELRRESDITRLHTELAARKATILAEKEARELLRKQVRSLLSEANRHLLAGEFEQARGPLEQVLQLDERNPGALFGMAQLASRAQDLDRALELYHQAAANAGEEIWIAGWSRMHRGKIFGFKGDQEKARAEWSGVLELRGDLRGAAEAARKALASVGPEHKDR